MEVWDKPFLTSDGWPDTNMPAGNATTITWGSSNT